MKRNRSANRRKVTRCFLLVLVLLLTLSLSGCGIGGESGSEKHNACAIFSLRLNKKCKVELLLDAIHRVEGVAAVEEL